MKDAIEPNINKALKRITEGEYLTEAQFFKKLGKKNVDSLREKCIGIGIEIAKAQVIADVLKIIDEIVQGEKISIDMLRDELKQKIKEMK